MYGLKRLLEIEAERKRKKEEKARIKKEKEDEKKRLKKIEHAKKLRKKQNRRAYLKRRKAELEERKKMGDEFGYFSIYITKNKKKVKFLGCSWWKTDAYKKYNKAIEKNKTNIVFPKTCSTDRKNGSHTKKELQYEILLVKKTQDGEKTTSSFRNKEGKFVENIISDWDNHIIVDKHDWFLEETFAVYGYHPKKDRKTYSFILNKFLIEQEDSADEMKKIIVFKNRVIIQYTQDFDFITCFDNKKAKKLYDMLQKDAIRLKKKYIAFMGETKSTKWLDKIEEKTGWNRNSIIHKTTAY